MLTVTVQRWGIPNDATPGVGNNEPTEDEASYRSILWGNLNLWNVKEV
jgi:hypothetical protein